MKKYLLTTALLIFVVLQGVAQRFDYENTSKIFFGLNIGSVWHTSDVENAKERFPLGAGFVFGGSMNQNYGNAVSFDLRFRYLGGTWYGKDSDTTSAILNNYAVKPLYDTLGYTVQNFRAAQHRFALELSMHANRFKERTGIDPYIFGGIGFTASTTKGDLLLNSDASIYPYDQTPNGSSIDEKYETLLDMNSAGDTYTPNAFDVKVLPSLGIGVGYYFNNRFSMGIEHKTTFFMDDYFDGTTVNQDGKASSLFKNDLYHYTSIYFKWYLRASKNTWEEPINDKPIDPVTEPTRRDKPIVDFTNPSNSPHRTNSPNINLRATVKNVISADYITFTGNEQRNTNFIFNPKTQTFEANVQLVLGLNTFYLMGENQFGKSRDLVEIYYEILDRGNPPIVKITNPTLVPFYTNLLKHSVTADIRNVDSRNNVKVWLNDQIVTHFDFNASGNNNFLIHLNLKAGTNTLRIEGRNDFGQDVDEAIIIYRRESGDNYKYPPTVTIITPNARPYSTTQSEEIVIAKVINVDTKQQIEVRVNGTKANNFTFNKVTNLIQFNAALESGTNTIRVSASNVHGNAFDETQIIYRRGTAGNNNNLPPVVSILAPSVSPYTTAQPYENIQATIENVELKNQMNVTINGANTNNFAFNRIPNSTSAQVQLNAVLNLGTNTVRVTATNSAGNHFDETQIIYRRSEPNTGTPPLVDILTPNVSPFTTNQLTESIIAKVSNVSAKQQIEVRINGTLTNNFTFNNTTSRVELNAGLNSGTNTIRISASNMYGNDFDETQIVYRRSEPNTGIPPVVEILTPNVNPFTTDQMTASIVAKVENTTTKQQIEVRVNGTITNNFAFNSGTSRVQFTASLNGLSNTIRISASNAYGNAFDETQIIYKRKPVVNPPLVSFVAPLTSQQAVTIANYTMIAKAENVTKKSDVSVNFNGNIVNPNDYTFNTQTQTVTYQSSLVVGSNTFTVSGTNASGTDQATAKIERKKRVIGESPGDNNTGVQIIPCDLPTIDLTSPSAVVTQIDESIYNISGTIQHIDNQSQIEVYLNGRRMDGYTYNQATKTYTHNVKFEEGKNTYVIRLTNKCGSIDKELTFNKTPEPTCGVKFEMLNIRSEFCLTTPTGAITNKDLLTNPKFTYSGKASSLYFKATSNGLATVNGVDYKLINGNYYLFTGILTVDISKNRPNMAGNWSICVTSGRPPLFGKGRSKPINPCAIIDNAKPNIEIKDKPETRGTPSNRKTTPINRQGSKTSPETKEVPSRPNERGGKNLRNPE